MTERTPATETREVSQPLRTPGKNSVLSEPTSTVKNRQLNNPLRSKSNSTKWQSDQLKQLSGPERSSNGQLNPDRKYYKPSTDTKTYFVNSQGHIQSREDPQEIIKPNAKGKLPDSKEAPIYHEPGSIVINGTEELRALYPNSFDRLGSLKGEYDIRVDPTVKPQQHSRRKVPIESKEAIEKEIDYMLEEGIVVEQIEPTPWVSSATFPKKANGDTRVCLDPKDLNKAIIRENHKPMTVEEIAHQLAGAVVYTKADALKAFLQVHLTYEASLLTTFNYHRGRLRFLRMPFGAKMSQDVFQLRMDAILEQCPGVIGIHDDIVIFGTSNEDHDANLINLMNVCQKEGLVLNSKKLELRKERVTFFGAEYSAAGMHPDPKKIQGIVEMTAPEDKQQLQSFLGMVNYMGTFIPNLSHHTEPLRSMLKQDNVFTWDEVKTRSFQQIKALILKANETPLHYYDRLKPVTVQADASLRGLGACLVQDNQPIAFASKSLTGAESRYANIERELLAIVFACQRFSTYLLGRSFVAESDHKPLEMIAMKNLANAPPRLQRMLLQLQRYDVTIKYRPGSEMQLVDALSRCPARASPEIKLNMRVDYVAFSRSWIETIKEQLAEDPILATVYQLTQQGWPHQRRHVPRVARRYFDFRDELATDNGLLLKGPCLVIPNSLKEEYLHRLHEGHLSVKKTQDNAREHLYWPGIDADISDYHKRCQECIKRSRMPKEPLQPHDIPEGPWLKLGMDYFTFNGTQYVLISDYFSKFPYVFKAKTSFWCLRDHLINLFAIEGYPDEIVTDNGPPFNSQDFNRFLSKLGITHTTSSPLYPWSNGSVERMVQTVKTLLSKNSNTRSFQEVLADLRATRIGTGLPSPAEILHGRNPATKEACHIDYKAIRAVLQERQLKMKLSHDKSHRAKKARPLVTGERCYALGPKNKWLECFIVGIRDTGRSYDIQIEATGTQLTRNRSHIRPRSPDIPLMHELYLQQNSVLSEEPSSSGTPDTSNSNKNSILSATSSPPKREQTVNHTGTSNSVLSGPSSMNISKPTLTSKASVSDTATRSKGTKHTRFNEDPVSSIQAIPARTVKTKRPSTRNRRSPIATFNVTDPDLLIPLQQAVTGIPDQRDAQPTVPPSPSASLSANPQPSSRETTTKEPSVVLPVSQTAGQETESESSSSSSSESSSESSSSSGSSSEASSTTTSPSTGTTSASSSTSTSPEMLELERSIGTIISHERDRLGHAVTRNNLDGAKQRILMMQQVIQQQRPRPVSAPPAASQPLPPYPGRRLSDTGSMSKVQAGNAIPRTSTPETNDRLQDIQDQPRRRIGPSRVKELAKYFTPTSDEDDNSRVNTRTRRKKLFPPR